MSRNLAIDNSFSSLVDELKKRDAEELPDELELDEMINSRLVEDIAEARGLFDDEDDGNLFDEF